MLTPVVKHIDRRALHGSRLQFCKASFAMCSCDVKQALCDPSRSIQTPVLQCVSKKFTLPLTFSENRPYFQNDCEFLNFKGCANVDNTVRNHCSLLTDDKRFGVAQFMRDSVSLLLGYCAILPTKTLAVIRCREVKL